MVLGLLQIPKPFQLIFYKFPNYFVATKAL
jgi:hypothetical protein